jgi:hypothetical protein
MRNSKKQRQGQCIFCGGDGLSKEHFWPEWAAPLLPSYPINQHVEQRFVQANKVLVAPPKTRNKPGNAWTKKIRVVCKTCNNGWMSKLETAVEPALTPLIKGDTASISETDGLTIARWITLKVLVAEHNTQGSAVATVEQRRVFRDSLTIPDNFKIWIGRCGVDGWQTAYWRHDGTVSASPDIKPEHSNRNIHQVTFGVGTLLITVIHTTVKELPVTFDFTQGGLMTALFPSSGSIEWPSSKSLTSFEATQIARILDSLFRSDKVLWKPLPSE